MLILKRVGLPWGHMEWFLQDRREERSDSASSGVNMSPSFTADLQALTGSELKGSSPDPPSSNRDTMVLSISRGSLVILRAAPPGRASSDKPALPFEKRNPISSRIFLHSSTLAEREGGRSSGKDIDWEPSLPAVPVSVSKIILS